MNIEITAIPVLIGVWGYHLLAEKPEVAIPVTIFIALLLITRKIELY